MTRDEKLLKQLNKGDKESLDELVGLYYPEIFRYCIWHTRDRFTAEDAVQETFLKAVRYLDRAEYFGNFRAFLYRIATNTCIDLWRKRNPEELDEELPFCEAGFSQAESDEDLEILLKGLDGELREIVLLRFAQELTLREIAECTGTPLRTVQSRLRSALKKLKGNCSQPLSREQ